MDAIAAIEMTRRRDKVEGLTRVAQAFVPNVAASIVTSIGNILAHKDDYKNQKLLRAQADKVRTLAMQTLTRQDPVAEEAKDNLLGSIADVLKDGAWRAIKTFCRFVFRGVMFLVENVVVPVFRVFATAVVDILEAALTTPAGWIALGATAAAIGGYYLYKTWQDKNAKREVPSPEPAIGARIAPAPAAPVTPEAPAAPVPAPAPVKPAQAPVPTKAAPVPAPSPVAPRPVAIPGMPTVAGARPEIFYNAYTVSKVKESDTRREKALGIKNNNPGNLRYAEQPGATGQNKGFAVFPTQALGLYNLGRQLEFHGHRGWTTVEKLIKVYAPPSENRTDDYIKAVASAMGVKASDSLDFLNVGTLVKLMKAIVTHENGSNPYSDDQFIEAAEKAIDFARQGYRDHAQGFVALFTPTSGRFVSPFGPRSQASTDGLGSTDHKGIDIANGVGTPIFAAEEGTVTFAAKTADYGNRVDIKHDFGFTRYGHMNVLQVKNGQHVKRGQKIGEMGQTGHATGPHLHFEVITAQAAAGQDARVDPAHYLPNFPTQKEGAVLVGEPIVANMDKPKDYVYRDGRLILLRD